jgi:hypothetical protein
MGAWLSKVFNALSLADTQESVRAALRTAQRERAKVALEVTSATRPSVMTTLIEQVRDDDVIVSQPSVGGHTYPLAFGEQLGLSFTLAAVRHSGSSRCLGRIKIPSGSAEGGDAQHMLFGYRLSLPDSLQLDGHAAQPGPQRSLDRPIEAHLYAPGAQSGPALAILVDISMSGARLHAPLPPPWLSPGQSVFLKAMLPDPVGLIDEQVDVVTVEAATSPDQHVVAITFRRRINGLSDLLRAAA